ncbi:olfactory receptor 2AT4-like [Amia ocellicauda]|uniref:olfactory receptor 2AT4-like n=1 Tax=Amia ocellicauda TaxID=2972642 RepID=UPI0034645B13
MSDPNTSLPSASYFIIVGVPSLQEHYTTLFFIFLLLFLATILGNLLIVVLVSLDPRLHTPMYFFLWNLAVLDMLLTITIIPKLLAVLLGYNRISFAGCFLQMHFFISISATEGFLVGVMAYDRYVAVVKPLHYNAIISTRVCLTMTATVWALGFLAPLVRIIMSVGKMKTVESRKKAFYMCSSHIVVVMLYYVSSAVVYIALRVDSISPDGRVFVGGLYYFLTPLANPIIYSLRNEKIKAAAQSLTSRPRFCLFLACWTIALDHDHVFA